MVIGFTAIIKALMRFPGTRLAVFSTVVREMTQLRALAVMTYITGGMGVDMMNGGAGADTFYFNDLDETTSQIDGFLDEFLARVGFRWAHG